MTCKAKNFYILLTFSLISISLLIFGSIYWYLIIYRPKQEHRLPYYDTSNKLKEIGFHNIIQKWVINIKTTDIRNCTYYFFNGIINRNIFDPNKTKIDEKSYKNILVYYIGMWLSKNLAMQKLILHWKKQWRQIFDVSSYW